MTEKDRIFLTPDEARSAVLIDLRQYAPQARLFLDLCPLILSSDTVVIEDIRHRGVWMAAPGHNRMRLMNVREFGEQLCRRLEETSVTPEVMADLCSRVFQTPAYPVQGSNGGDQGIWVETGMEDFRCRQCGRCCHTLDYHHELTAEDYRLWQELGRTDITERVGIFRRNGRIQSYTIWVEPDTGRRADICPWLKKVPGSDRRMCAIHEVKPEICRQYPGSRKHAQMTGCPGFG